MNTHVNKIIVFDLHDVLFTRDYWKTVNYLYTLHNKPLFMKLILNPYFVYDALKTLSITKVSEAYLVKLAQNHPNFELFIEHIIDMTNALKPITEMFSLVENLKKNNKKVYIFSNIGYRTYQKLTEAYQFFFNQFDGVHYVDAQNDWIAKPHHNAYALFLEKFNINPHEMIFIDNKYKNVAAAQAFGITAIHYKSSKQVYRQLTHLNILT